MGELVFEEGDYNATHFTPIYRTVGELISFADLLLRWPFKSFYPVSFFAGLETPETPGDYDLHLRLARSVGLRYESAENADKTTLIIVLSDCPRYSKYDFLLRHADMLYFDRQEVEAIEAEHPECRIVDISQRNRNPLFYTTPRNIRTVGALTLYHWQIIAGIKNERFRYTDDLKYPGEQWEMGDTIHFPGAELPKLPKERTWPDLPVEMPEGNNYKRNNDLDSIQPLLAEVRALGIREAGKMAKIIYSFYPQLTAHDIGTLFPATPSAVLDKQSIRDRGRTLLGKRKRSSVTTNNSENPTYHIENTLLMPKKTSF